jgi:hypothetical protein
VEDEFEVFSAPVGGGTPPVPLSGPLDAGFDAFSLSLFGDGRVVYSTSTSFVWQIHSVPVDGSAPPTVLTPLLTATGNDRQAELTHDGSGVLYVARRPGGTSLELFHVSIDGSAPPELISGPLVAGGNVVAFEASSDGRHVIYHADQEWDDVFELFSCWLGRPVRRATLR